MAYDSTITGRVRDPSTGEELIVENGVVLHHVPIDVDVQEVAGVHVHVRPGETVQDLGNGHHVVLRPDQEWVPLPGDERYAPRGGFVRNGVGA